MWELALDAAKGFHTIQILPQENLVAFGSSEPPRRWSCGKTNNERRRAGQKARVETTVYTSRRAHPGLPRTLSGAKVL